MENPFTGLKAALFDLDGTLIDTHIDFGLMKRETLQLASSAGIDTTGLDSLDVLSIVERGRDQIAHGQDQDRADAFRARAFAMLEQIEVSHCANPVEIPGARELLRQLDATGIGVGIVTRNSRQVAARLAREYNLIHRVLLTRDDVARTKPDPSHLLCAIAAMGFDPATQPPNVPTVPTLDTRHPTPFLMVGDHWMDAQAGRAAGMRTVGLLRGRHPSFYDSAPPDYLINELAELLPLARAA